MNHSPEFMQGARATLRQKPTRSMRLGVVSACCLMLGSVPLLPNGVAAGENPAGDRSATERRSDDQNIDRSIRMALERQLNNDAAVPAHLVDVQVKDGIVSLSGSIDNLLARERATDLARTIRGVRSVVNKIEVHAPPVKDAVLDREIKKALAADPATDLYEVGVQVQRGAAILTGTVGSIAERELAGDVAKSVKGVTNLKNDIVVKPRAKRADAEIAADIKSLLQQNPWVTASAVDVAVKDGQARLSGTLPSAIGRSYAIDTAWVPGVIEVDASELKVQRGAERRPANPLTDEQIAALLEKAFRLHPRLAEFDLNVESDQHIVTLEGKVDNFRAKNAAEEIARNTAGVTGVQNLIKVRPGTVPEDAVLGQAVREALLRDAYVSRFDIAIRARNGKVFLSGRTDSSFEKDYAEQVASRVQGVADVRNDITVVDLEVPRKTDWALQQDIAAALRWNPFVDRDQITVAVERGIATLTGNVDSWQEKTAAAESARRAGAESLLNRLEVKNGGTPRSS